MSCSSKIGKRGSVRRRHQQPLPGNDGQWFLKLVGAVPGVAGNSPPEPTQPTEEPAEDEKPSALAAVAALRDQPADAPDTTATLAPPATIDLAASTAADPAEDEEYSHATQAAVGTGATLGVSDAVNSSRSEPAPTEVIESTQPPTAVVAQPTRPSPTLADTWRAESKPPPPADWAAEPLADPKRRARRSRWPLIVTVVVAAAAVVVAALWLPTLVDGRATEQASEYRIALLDVRDSLPGSQEGLQVATEPSSQQADLLGVASQVNPLALASDSALAVASEPLPEPLPLLPSGSIDDLVPSRDAVAVVGAAGTDIVARIDDTTTYRLLVADILVLPELPIEADAFETAALGAELATIDATSRNAAAQLPSDPAFADHKALVTEAVAGFDEWAAEYLNTLTEGDAAAAAELITQLETSQVILTSSLVPSLATLRHEVDAAIVVLHADTTAALAALP